jgi:hypothetical protein
MHTTLVNPIGTVSTVRQSGPRSGSGDVEGTRLDNTVSTVGRVSDNGHGADPTSSARTGALTAQTMLTMLTQNSRPSTESYDQLGCGRAVDAGIPLPTCSWRRPS